MENRRKAAPPAATLDINCDCKEAIVDYLTRAFPTRQMEEYTDDLGDVRTRPMWDEAGNPVINPQAEAAREQLIEHICAMPPIPRRSCKSSRPTEPPPSSPGASSHHQMP